MNLLYILRHDSFVKLIMEVYFEGMKSRGRLGYTYLQQIMNGMYRGNYKALKERA